MDKKKVIELMERRMPSFVVARRTFIEIDGKNVRLSDLSFPWTKD